jgi:hypothetical protein
MENSIAFEIDEPEFGTIWREIVVAIPSAITITTRP